MLKKILTGIVGFIVLVVFLSSFTTVKTGEKAVVLHWGAYEGKVLEPGLHWLNPFSEGVVKMDVTLGKQEAEVRAATSDLQDVTTKVALNHRLDSDKAGEIYSTLKTDWESRVVVPSLNEAIKAVTAKYTAEQLVTKREEARSAIKDLITEKLAAHHIIVEDLNIVNFEFSPSFNSAIEAKVTAEQSALAAKNKLEQSKYEAEQRIAQAKGEAEAIKIQAEAIQSQGGSDYVQLQAIAKWNGVLPTSFVPGSAVPFLNLK